MIKPVIRRTLFASATLLAFAMLPDTASATLKVSGNASSTDMFGVKTVDLTPCPSGATSCTFSAGSASAFASASYGSVDGAVTSSSVGMGSKATANSMALFTDQFSFFNGTGSPTHFEVGIDATGSSVSGAEGAGEFAEIEVLMTLADTVDLTNMVFARYDLDIEHGDLTISGLPLNLLSLDLPDGHDADFSLQIFLDSEEFNGDTASVVDPTSVFVSASNPYASESGTVYPTSFDRPSSVPEPATWAMMLLGLGSVGVAMRRRRTTALT